MVTEIEASLELLGTSKVLSFTIFMTPLSNPVLVSSGPVNLM